jgi:hypothetical protein
MGEMRYAYRILIEKLQGKRLFGRPRSRWENVRMDLRKIVCEGVDWMHLAQDMEQCRTLVNAVINLRVPQMEENFLTS